MEFVIIDADNQRILFMIYDSYDLLMFLYVIFVTNKSVLGFAITLRQNQLIMIWKTRTLHLKICPRQCHG